MKFLCERHRAWLSRNPGELLSGWLRTLIEGRAVAAEGHADKAILYFGNALDMAEIMMSHGATVDAQQRYIDTATELMQVVWQCRKPSTCQDLFAVVLNRLEQEPVRLFLPGSLDALYAMALGSVPAARTAGPSCQSDALSD